MSSTGPYAELLEATHRCKPRLGVVFGSGLGGLVERVRVIHSLPYHEVPGLGASTVHGHRGQITLGDWSSYPVVLFEGRLHYYEGHPWNQVIAPVQTAEELGVRTIIHTNAAGGIHDDLEPGSLMLLTDHIEWTRPYWWRHPGRGGMGSERPSPYSASLCRMLLIAARKEKIGLREGVYACLTGPSYETPAEIRALRSWGADAVGMSTAREVQAGAERGLECAAISCITNRAAGLSGQTLHHEEVLATAAAQTKNLANLLERFLTLLLAEAP